MRNVTITAADISFTREDGARVGFRRLTNDEIAALKKRLSEPQLGGWCVDDLARIETALEELAFLRAMTVTDAMVERFIWKLCCGTDHCNAACHAPDWDMSADRYAEMRGCESDADFPVDRIRAALEAAIGTDKKP